jgi:hypothetical protein
MRLDGVLDLVAQFEAAAVEELDAVVGGRVVRGRQHDAEIRVEGMSEIGHRGSGQHPETEHVDARTGKTGDHRCLEELTRGSRITPDHRDRPMALERPDSPSTLAAATESSIANCAVRSRLATPRTPSVPKRRPITHS